MLLDLGKSELKMLKETQLKEKINPKIPKKQRKNAEPSLDGFTQSSSAG